MINTKDKNKIFYSEKLLNAVESKFGIHSDEYEAAINGDYALGSMIEEYCYPDQIPADQFIIAYEQGDDELWRYYQMFIQNQDYRKIYNMWLEAMHTEDVENYAEFVEYAE
jgi:hypothetical protein